LGNQRYPYCIAFINSGTINAFHLCPVECQSGWTNIYTLFTIMQSPFQ
jgi:hypothetical protein